MDQPALYVLLESMEKGDAMGVLGGADRDVAQSRADEGAARRQSGRSGDNHRAPGAQRTADGWITKMTYSDGRYFLFSE